MSSDIRASIFEGGIPVTPTDNAPIGPFASLYIGGAGTVTITDIKGNKTSYTMLAGSYLYVQGTIVWATGTSATLIVALLCKPVGA